MVKHDPEDTQSHLFNLAHICKFIRTETLPLILGVGMPIR
jgi:hypothetical protein